MKTIHFRERTDDKGTLHLPIGEADADCEVVVVVKAAPKKWLPGFWERLIANSEGEPWVRPDQGIAETRDELK